MDRLAHKQRLIDEKAAIDGVLPELSHFIDGPLFKHLIPSERRRVSCRRAYLDGYSGVLADKIAAL